MIHPNYNGYTLDNDFWLIRLEKDSRFPIVELDKPNDDLDLIDDELVVFGFGTTQQGGNQPNVIQEVTVDYFENDQCGNYGPFDLTDNMLCAGRQGKDSCQVRMLNRKGPCMYGESLYYISSHLPCLMPSDNQKNLVYYREILVVQ